VDSSDSDPYEAEFALPRGDSDEEEGEGEWREEEGAAVAKNHFHLECYPKDQLLRVYMRNLPFKVRREEFLKAYSAHAEGILNVIIDKDEEGYGIGTGYFIANPAAAERIVKLEGRRLLDRPLFF
jgi:hypothetical protein